MRGLFALSAPFVAAGLVTPPRLPPLPLAVMRRAVPTEHALRVLPALPQMRPREERHAAAVVV